MGNLFFNDKIRLDIERILGDDYLRVRDFFYNVCTTQFTYKVLLTRRAYVLYKIFLGIFESEEGFKVRGTVFNTQSLPLLLCKSHIDQNPSVLIIDDIIINGRTVGNVYRYLNKYFSKINIWCIESDLTAGCINEYKKHITHVEYVTPPYWERLSDSLTSVILHSNIGYVSFVNSYTLESPSSLDAVESALKNFIICASIENDSHSLRSLDIKSKLFFVSDSEINNYKFVIRLYENTNGLTIIPYVFLDDIPVSQCYEICYNCLKKIKENMPAFFVKNQTNTASLVLLYQYTVCKLSDYYCKYIFKKTKFNLQLRLSCDESYTKLNDLSETCLSNNGSISHELGEVEECMEIFRENADNDKDTMSNLIEYLSAIKVVDDERASKCKSRLVGLRNSDIFKLFQVTEDSDQRKILLETIKFWDDGKASYIIQEYDGIISGFLRNGEQIFKCQYEQYPLQYVIIFKFCRITKDLSLQRLHDLAKFIDRSLRKKNKSNFANFTEFVNKIGSERQFFYDLSALQMHFENNIINGLEESEEAMEEYISQKY